MTTDELLRYYTKRMQEAEQELEGFNNAVAQHGLRVIHKVPGSPERDVTDANRKSLEDAVSEYREMIRACTSG
jgi:hypothetical protein